jgi:hypothetical protein
MQLKLLVTPLRIGGCLGVHSVNKSKQQLHIALRVSALIEHARQLPLLLRCASTSLSIRTPLGEGLWRDLLEFFV